jgi:hypothetical protein
LNGIPRLLSDFPRVWFRIVRGKLTPGAIFGNLTEWQDSSGNAVSWLDSGACAILKHKVNSQSATYTATTGDEAIPMDASGAARVVNLPAASTMSGKVLRVIKTDSSSNTVTVDGNGSETINGQLTWVLSRSYEYVEIISTGSAWIVLGRSFHPDGVYSTSTSGSAVSIDSSIYHFIAITASASFTINAPTNMINGQAMSLEIRNSSGGSITVTHPSSFDTAQVSIGALATGKVAYYGLRYTTVNGVNKWRVLAYKEY